jgi:N-acyl-D-aspartate/D-glutamate deacylase
MPVNKVVRSAVGLLCLLLVLPGAVQGQTQTYDLVLAGGRVIDPESGLDGIRNVGIDGGQIVAISGAPLKGHRQINVAGKVVAPGFIDLHTHSPTPLGQYYQLRDGVTTALELEAGAFPVAAYGDQVQGQALINYGSSVGYIWIRALVKEGIELPHMTYTPSLVGWEGVKTAVRSLFSDSHATYDEPATGQELPVLRRYLEAGLDAGGLGVGLALDYISEAVGAAELAMIFDLAGERGVPVFIHVRRGINGDPSGLREALAQAKRAHASVHICHVSHNAMRNIELFLAEIRTARAEGVDVTTELLPYNAGSALISSAVFGRNWQEVFAITYGDVEWAETGMRFTEQSFNEYRREQPQGQVIHHYMKEAWTRRALQEPGVMVVSDLLPMTSLESKVAPHNGAFSRVLGRYVREDSLLELPQALARMTLLPARRLEQFAPVFSRKGRLQVGADADITVFDPDTVLDQATYADPYQPSRGIETVIVNGVVVLQNEQLREDVYPGQRLLSGEIRP